MRIDFGQNGIDTAFFESIRVLGLYVPPPVSRRFHDKARSEPSSRKNDFYKVKEAQEETANMFNPTNTPSAGMRIICSTCSLREFCLADDLDFKEIERMEEMVTTRRRIRRGEALYRAGDPFEAFYAIRLGFLKSSVLSSDGREQVTMFYMSGDIIGFDGLANNVYASDVVALEDTEVCVLSYKRLHEVSSAVPKLAEHFERLLSREIIRQNGVLLLLGSMHAEQRIAAFLLNLSQRFEQRGYSRSEFVLRMTRAEIGSYLGLKLETVSRVLSRFTTDNVIIVNQKHVQILDFEALRSIVSGQVFLRPEKPTQPAESPGGIRGLVSIRAK